MRAEPSELLALTERAVRKTRAAGAEKAEVYLWSARSWETREAGALRSVQESDESGVSVRVSVGGRRASATTSGIHEGDVAWAIDRAVTLAELMPRSTGEWHLPEPTTDVRPPTRVAPELAEPEPDRLVGVIEAASEALDRTRGLGYKAATLVTHEGRFVVGNTNGLLAWDQNAHELFTAELRGEAADTARTMRIVLQERVGVDRGHDVGAALKDAARLALDSRKAQRLTKPADTLILDPQCMWQIVEGIIRSFAGHAANESRSRFAGLIGERVASPLLTIIDDPLDGVGVRNQRCDDQGAPVIGPLPLIENGVLRNHAHDTSSAKVAGVAPTGHGLRSLNGRYSSAPRARVGNAVVQPGASDGAVLEEAERAVLVSGSLLGSFTMNPVTGDLSCTAPLARLVENGRDVAVLKSVSIGGNVFDALEGIEALSQTNQRFPRGACGSARLKGLTASS